MLGHGDADDGLAAARLDAFAPAEATRGWLPDGAQPLTVASPAEPSDDLPAFARAPFPPAAGLTEWWQRARVSPEAARLRWLAFAALAAVLVVGFVVFHGASGRPPVESYRPLPVPSPVVTSSAGPQIVVDVGGRVRHPGLVTLPAGSRVADALAAAGGALRSADIATLDLAARVSDGQLLLIGVPGGDAQGAAQSPGGAGPGPIDLNAATVDQLDALPGVGPVLAQHIVDWRQQHGGFTAVDQLRQVPGIGPRKFDQLKSLVVV